MTVGQENFEVIDLTDDLAEESVTPESNAYADRESVRISMSTKITTDDTDKVLELVNGLLNLPELPRSLVHSNGEAPPKPLLGLCKARETDGLTLVWHIGNEKPPVTLKKYEVWISQDPHKDWMKVGDVEALTPPISCTLSQVKENVLCYFAVRAIDIDGREGPFSVPCNFTKKIAPL